MCDAPLLEQVALSVNFLTGKLSPGIGRHTAFVALRVASNRLSGTLPDVFGSMTSLQVFGVSGNSIEGTVTASLGMISGHLTTTKLHSNLLSCELPSSVLNWNAANGFNTVEILTGNLFACNGLNGIFNLALGSGCACTL